MPKLSCICGNVINLSPVPNEDGYRLLWEPKLEGIIEQLLNAFEDKQTLSDFEKSLHSTLFRTPPAPPQVYECENCGRLAVFAHPSDDKPAIWYARDIANGDTRRRLKNLVSPE